MEDVVQYGTRRRTDGSPDDATRRPVSLLLNVAHALDHLFLLVFATAVTTIALEFGFARWEDLMPYSVGAFLMFGLGSLPVGPPGRPVGTAPDDAGVLLRHRRVGAAGGADARPVAIAAR